MRNTVFYLCLGILGTALVLLVLFGESGSIAGLSSDQFASSAQLGAIAVLVGAGLLATRHRMNMRLWYAAVWLALLVALIAGYETYVSADVVPDAGPTTAA